MPVNKQAVIDHLKQIAHLFNKKKDVYRARAFTNVAGVLQARSGALPIKNGELVEKIPGVGSAIKDVIEEFVASGSSRKLEKLKKELPNEVFERFDSKVCKRKTSELLKPLTTAGVDWGFAGSIRRGSPTCKDVDIVVCLHNEKKERALVAKLLKNAGLKADVRNGQKKIGVSVPIKTQGRSFTLDLNFTYPENRGSMYLYFTGPQAYNINQRSLAKKKGMRLNQDGLFKNGKKIAGATEEEMFKALGLKFVEATARA